MFEKYFKEHVINYQEVRLSLNIFLMSNVSKLYSFYKTLQCRSVSRELSQPPFIHYKVSI